MLFSPSEWHLSEGEDRARLITMVCGGRMRSNRFQLKQERFTVDIKEQLFACKDRQAAEEAVQGGCTASTPGDFQALSG